MKITVIVPPKLDACIWYRLFLPYKFDNIMVSPENISHKVLTDTKFLVFHKSFFSFQLIQLVKYKYKHIKVVIDVDDSLDLPSNHILYKQYIDNNEKKKVLKCLDFADIITVSTLPLKDEIKTYLPNKNVIINPNFVEYQTHRCSLNKKEIVLSGGSTHLNDYRLIEGLKIENISVFYSQYQKMFKGSNLLKPIPVEKFIEVYKNFNISIAPLEDNHFNRCKSNLKFIEAANTHTLFIGSNVYPYQEVTPEIGYLFNDKEELKHILNNLTTEDIRIKTENAFRYVNEHYNPEKLRTNLKNILNLC